MRFVRTWLFLAKIYRISLQVVNICYVYYNEQRVGTLVLKVM